MRNITSWRQNLAKDIRQCWPKESPYSNGNASRLCDVELGLFLLTQVAPSEGGEAVWALLQGYDFGCSFASRQQIAVARHLLNGFRSPAVWKKALDSYMLWPDSVRGFECNDSEIWRQKPLSVSVAPGRFNIYNRALTLPVPHRESELSWAQTGSYRFDLNGIKVTASIPEEMCFEVPKPHVFPERPTNPPLRIPWDELLITASWMDEAEASSGLPTGEEAGNWYRRLKRVELRVRKNNSDTLEVATELQIEGLFHIAGMVSSGKSTMMEVLAVHLARQGKRVTMVLADVVDVLRRAALFSRLGIKAAPVLGATGRESHLNRLHRVMAAEQPYAGLQARHGGFRWLSTVCGLDGLRQIGYGVLPLDARPCTQLIPSGQEGEDNPRACPIFANCEFHRASLDLREAQVWLATPASLVYTRVAPQLSQHRLLFAEMVYRTSDLVIFDEADRVQTLLDAAFSPSEILINRGDRAWMPRLEQHVSRQVNSNRSVLSSQEVADWCQSRNNTQQVTQRLDGLLQRESDVRKWVTRRNYFTALLLFERLALECSGANAKGENGDPAVYQKFKSAFDICMDDPLGGNTELSNLANAATTNNNVLDSRIQEWIQKQFPEDRKLSTDNLKKLAKRLESALLVTILQNQLAYLLKMWRNVEAPLSLEDGGNLLFHRPPNDFKPVLPLPPMGRELAFQYLPPDDNPNGPGDLRFFRCEAVGRALLLHFHKLWEGDGMAGPHVVLLSGTSWAGASPSCHVQATVGGILQAPDREIEAIENSEFRFLPLRYQSKGEKKGQPIRVSGLDGNQRSLALREILTHLAVPHESGLPSLLENERAALPEGRKRVLLLTGSYSEAQLAYDWFTNEAPNRDTWRGKVQVLVPDTADVEESFDAGQLPRGLVHQFGEGEAWILIAPLLAIERGHNIIDENGRAALGSAYFLVRPHPRPDDIAYAIYSINRWAMEQDNTSDSYSVLEKARNFRKRGRIQWNTLIRSRLQWSTLSDEGIGRFNEREAVTWTQMVAIWQVIGRLVRGGQPARVFFCDAAFAPYSATLDQRGDDARSSLLVSMRVVLRPYFDLSSDVDPFERTLVRTLYGPLFKALERMYGLSERTALENDEFLAIMKNSSDDFDSDGPFELGDTI